MRGIIDDWHQFIDVKKLQPLQDAMSRAANVALIIVNYLGEPVSRFSNCSALCKEVQGIENMASRCTSCFSRGGFEAAKRKEPFLYQCHLGLFVLAVPIIVEGHYVGSLLAGQFLPNDEKLLLTTEKILSQSSDLSNLINGHLFHDIPTLTSKQLDSITEVLFALCNLIVTEAIDHHQEKIVYQALLKNNNILTDIAHTKNFELSSIHISEQNVNILNPLFEFMKENPDTDLSLSDAAALCHLSQCYFSRLFTLKTGKYYSNYRRKKKMDRAKYLLEQTDLLVTQISDALGFNDPSYFIRIFKKHEGTTPHHYRKALGRTT